MFIYICTCIDTQPWKKWLSNRPYFFDSGQNKEFNQPTSLWLIQGNHKWTGRATLKLSPVHGQLHAALMCADTYQSISIHHIIPVHNIDRSFKHIYIYMWIIKDISSSSMSNEVRDCVQHETHKFTCMSGHQLKQAQPPNQIAMYDVQIYTIQISIQMQITSVCNNDLYM